MRVSGNCVKKLQEKVAESYGNFRDFGFYNFQTEQEKVENVFLGVLEELSHEEENKERLKKKYIYYIYSEL